MKIFALIGKSGTGKSYQAINLCHNMNIESIIDDGLFIFRGKAIAGKSAKKDATKVGAIKTAIFLNDEHCYSVITAIDKYKPDSLLIIGTSDQMVEKIATRLSIMPNKVKLTPIGKKIYIEDITSPNEQKLAHKYRHQQGKHVIPVSNAELKKQFSGYFLTPIKAFKSLALKNKDDSDEKSIVRPSYSYAGNFVISSQVIFDIIKCVAKDINQIVRVPKISTNNNLENLNIKLYVVIKKDLPLLDIAATLQQKSKEMIEQMTAFSINNLNVIIRSIE